MVLLILLQGETRPTWAYPLRYTVAVAFSVISMLYLLTRLTVMSVRSRGRTKRQRFHVPQWSLKDDL